jgi:hypothetical protein
MANEFVVSVAVKLLQEFKKKKKKNVSIETFVKNFLSGKEPVKKKERKTAPRHMHGQGETCQLCKTHGGPFEISTYEINFKE